MRERLNRLLAGRYAVERELGRGGMASVWLARDLLHDRPVALKVLHPELAGAIGVDRFLREVRLTTRLQHPNVVPVLDSGVLPAEGGTALPWFAMACIPGESLHQRLTREGQLPVDEAVRITEEAADALAAAHREGIVHRDIKPGNLLLAGGPVYVADFGIAKALVDTGAERLTSTGLALGTPTYRSPEQASAAPVDARTDQYSLACVLYEMLAGEPPFTGPTAQAIVARRLAETPRAIRSVRPTVPATVETAVLRALERVPADRFPDLRSFAAALRGPPGGRLVGGGLQSAGVAHRALSGPGARRVGRGQGCGGLAPAVFTRGGPALPAPSALRRLIRSDRGRPGIPVPAPQAAARTATRLLASAATDLIGDRTEPPSPVSPLPFRQLSRYNTLLRTCRLYAS